ncbi:MAG: precorrin-8X methylmutase [Thermodesulfovibrionales bacterium]|nr:precorrin-8X methylmutase [Thermodesulfovibrionales bacterium]
MDKIILVGHGSPEDGANNLHEMALLLHSLIHPVCIRECVKIAYLQFGSPDIMEAIEESVHSGAKRIIIHPFFLSKGVHVKRDIPEIIERARSSYPDREFFYTEPLGFNEWTARLVFERIKDFLKQPSYGEWIEKTSLEQISEEFGLKDDSLETEVIKRVIHATADPEFRDTLLFHPEAIRTGIRAIKSGKDILVDVEMVKAGINKRGLEPFGGKVICNINNEDVVRLSKETGRTRAETAIEMALKENSNIGIIAIGNAPTALLKVIEIFNNPSPITYNQSLVIGVPVGFVNALESKVLLSSQKFPFITNISRKGGSSVAASIVNALIKITQEVSS